MIGHRFSTKFLWVSLGILVFLLPACSPAPTPVAAPTQQAVQPTVAIANTATQPPTATTAPTATALPPTPTLVPPTSTPTPVPADEQVISWCIPKEQALYVKAGDDPAAMPEKARAGKLSNGVIDVATPDLSCTFVFNLGTPLKDGTVLEVLDGMDQVWLKKALIASPKNPNLSYVVLTHSYITDPPFWSMVYKVALKGADGTALWNGKLNVHSSWMPDKCWDGTMPNMKTLYCKKQQDLHPWDPAYPHK